LIGSNVGVDKDAGHMPNSEQNDEECDATKVDSSNSVDSIIIFTIEWPKLSASWRSWGSTAAGIIIVFEKQII